MVGVFAVLLCFVTYGLMTWWAGSMVVRGSNRGFLAVVTLLGLLVVLWFPAFAISAIAVSLFSFDTGRGGAYFSLPYLFASLVVFGVGVSKIAPKLRSKPKTSENASEL